MIHEVYLHGALGQRFGARHAFDVGSVREVARALSSNFDGAREAIRQGAFRIEVDGRDIDETELDIELPGARTIAVHLTPVLQGAGGNAGGVAKIVLGVVMITAGVALSYFGGAGLPLIMSGVMMVGGGIASFFMPTPKTDLGMLEKPDERPSYLFNGPVNTSSQGAAIPVLFGRARVGSVVVSAGVEQTAVS